MKFNNIKSHIFIAVTLLIVSNIYGKDPVYFFNPGIKIGYSFGSNHGFVLGFETSVGETYWSNHDLRGIVVGYSHCFNLKENNNVYLEIEYGKIEIGGSAGLLFNTNKEKFNFYLRAFVGTIGYLSFRYPFGDFPSELSLIGKLPISPNPPVLD